MRDPGRVREWIYRQLIRSHPTGFRRAYGDEMMALFRESWRDVAVRGGRVRRVGFWVRLVVQETWAGIGERLRRRRRKQRGGAAASSLGDDLRLALRSVRRAPGVSAAIVATLGLGIGASTLVYSLVDFALLRPLPYPDAGRLVRIYLSDREDPADTWAVTGAHFLAFRGVSAFESLAASYTLEPTRSDVLSGGAPRRVRTLRVGSQYFGTLGASPILGRTFAQDEERGGAGVVVLSEGAWRTLHGSDPGAVGRAIVLDGAPHEVVGVVPSVPADPVVGQVDVYLPQDLTPGGANHADNNYLTVLGRLRPGISMEQARQRLAAASRAVEAEAPEAARWVPRVVPLQEDVVAGTRPLLLVLLGSVAVLLGIVCVNVANLLLARGTERRRELAIHAALGCSRSALVRRLLLESVILAVAGGLIGGLLAYWGVRVYPVLLADVGASHLWAPAIDGRILVLLSLTAASVGVAVGLVPALRAARTEPERDLRGGRHGMDGGARRLRDVLAIAQVSIALVLLASAAVLVVTFERFRQVQLGFAADDVLTFTVALPDGEYDAAARARFHAEFTRRLSERTGAAVGAVSRLPATGSNFSWGTGPLTGPLGGDDRGWIQADQRVVSGDYFAALEIPLLAGRLFTPSDRADAPRRFLVNAAAAERLYPAADPVGQRLRVAFLRGAVIGVVGNTAVDVEGRAVPKVYHAHDQFADNRNWLLHYVVAATDGARARQADVAALRSTLREMDPRLVLFEPLPLATVVGRSLADRRAALIFLLGFAGTATTLAVLGVYAVLARSMLQRRREIGIRLALGASLGSVRALVLRRALWIGLAGIALGLPAAVAFGRSLEFLAFRVTAADPGILTAVSALVLAVVVGAAWPTMRRATRVAPAAVLREE